ncbi:MAG: hypothetical protein RLY87_124 [Chloroflexota bacterium]|jgi:hypothetical protein
MILLVYYNTPSRSGLPVSGIVQGSFPGKYDYSSHTLTSQVAEQEQIPPPFSCTGVTPQLHISSRFRRSECRATRHRVSG